MIRRTIAAAVTMGALFSVCHGFSHAQQVGSSKSDVGVDSRTRCYLTAPQGPCSNPNTLPHAPCSKP
jgi:hypothetical protein